MPLNYETLDSLVGRLRENRPGAGFDTYARALNDAIRNTINRRTYWVDLRKRGIISVPDAVTAGTVSVATGSNVVTGTGTPWPVGDVLTTTMIDQIIQPGAQDVALTSMAGVTPDSTLLVDTGANQEAVAVAGIIPFSGRIYANFTLPHAASSPVTISSLTGLQFRTDYDNPIFTILGVPNSTTLLLDNPWGGAPLSGIGYWISRMYYTVFPNIRQFIAIVDQQQGIPLDFRVTQQELNTWDPQRTDQSDPLAFASLGPTPSGNMQYEIWPSPQSARQIAVLASLQWPPLINPDDMPPPFLEPTIFTNYATAALKRMRLSKDDPFYDLKGAQEFERLAIDGYNTAIDGDEALAIQDYKTQMSSMFPSGGANFWRSHDPLVMDWYF